MKIKCNGLDILSNNFTDKDKRKLDSILFCANNYKHPITDGYKHLPSGGQKGQIVSHDGTDATWKDFMDLMPSKLELFAYGVLFNINVADPHLTRIGNMSLHKSLPIQSELKGCIALGGKIIYWLHPDDWRFRKDPTEFILLNLTLVVTGNTYGIANNVFSTLLYDLLYVKINGIICKVTSINTVNKVATISPESTLKAGIYNVELGAVLNGYDGTVRVYCPEFYIKSEVDGDYRRVWISTIKIDATWIHLLALLIDAYKSAILNTAISGMGYLSTLAIPSAVSVVNTNTYCRGGSNRSELDSYLTSNPYRSDLGKPRTDKGLTQMRSAANNTESYIMTLHEYLHIFYWLYVIEYANFNSLEAVSDKTSEGYMYGGLGIGTTKIQNWNLLNNYSAVMPCGLGNFLGNSSGAFSKNIPSFIVDGAVYRLLQALFTKWHGFENIYGDIWQMLDGCIVDASNSNNSQYPVYTCDDPVRFANTLNKYYTRTGTVINSSGFIKSFNLGDRANILPSSIIEEDTSYICDYFTSSSNNNLCIVIAGGGADSASKSGIGCLNISFPTTGHWTGAGVRTVSPVVNN